ncbi:MAG: hypothetical protein CVU59_07145 [Deltaproteobacteria bacterium HGW-Deltaproteobacteria-17]|nr:MAG: hypothetical protein CVU59_07145 [Deltaproteobacteria bacterium HGW-Deltaproteobacteria-17]
MRPLPILFVLFLILPTAARAQSRRGVLVEIGPSVTDWGSRVSAGYFFHLTDQWVMDLGLAHSMWFPREHPAGQVTGTGHLRYMIDVLRVVPSVFVGVGAGGLLSGESPVTELEYGLTADYMISRRSHVGLSISGVTSVFGSEVTDDDGVLRTSITRMLVLLRFQWVFGETW